jgi:hypothetical protein
LGFPAAAAASPLRRAAALAQLLNTDEVDRDWCTLSAMPAAVAPIDPAVLDLVARGLACGVDHHVAPGNDRRWVHLLETEEYDAWLIAWPPGTGLGLHDHGGSGAAVCVVSGVLVERHVDGLHRELRTRVLRSGDGITFGADHVHSVENSGDVEALSVHVYSPPLRAMGYRQRELNAHAEG